MKSFMLLALLLLPLPPFIDSAFGAGALTITRITPEGEAQADGREIVVQFNRAVVPLGRMERTAAEIPITITPKLDCQWRWLSTTTLACQLDEKGAFHAATRYQLVVKPGIKAEDGASISKEVTHSFTTTQPKISYTSFQTWKAPGVPVIQVTFDQPVSESSASKHLFFARGKDARVAVKVEPSEYESKNPRYVWVKEAGGFVDFGEQVDGKPDDQLTQSKGEAARRVWIVTPVKELPADTTMALMVEPGLRSALGPELGTEDRAAVEFDTFPEFKFLGVRCYGIQSREDVLWDLPPAKAAACDPQRDVSLRFSTPVLTKEVKGGVTFSPDLAGGRKDFDPWENSGDGYSQLDRPRPGKGESNRDFEVRLPIMLKAATKYHIKGAVKDEFGRSLKGLIDFQFSTDHRGPSYAMPYRESVLEKDVDNDAPLYVQNLKSVTLSYQTLTPTRSEANLKREIKPAAVQDVRYAVPLGVRDMLQGGSGAVQGTITTEPKSGDTDEPAYFFSQVTPFHVLAKAGHFNSTVWVTDMKTGAPVPHAKVSIYRGRLYNLAKPGTTLAKAETDANGLATLPGLEKLDPKLKGAWSSCRDEEDCLIVRVLYEDNQALLPMANNFRVGIFEIGGSVYANQQQAYGHIHTWGTTAQGVYRAGDTMQYKIFVRNQDNKTLVPAPAMTYELRIVDPTGNDATKVSGIKLSKFGAYAGEFKIPSSAPVGWYSFQLKGNFSDRSWEAMGVLVSDFTPAPFKVEAELNGDLFRDGDTVTLNAAAKMHSGGPYPNAEGRMTAMIAPEPIRSDNAVAKGFTFESYDDEGESDDEGGGNNGRRVFLEKDLKVDAKGEVSLKIPLTDLGVAFGTLTIETAVKDERGKFVANIARAAYRGFDRFVGLRSSAWVFEANKSADFESLVIDEKGRPVAGVAVKVDVQRLETKESHVKGAGDAYLTQFTSEWAKTGDHCNSKSAAEPSPCKFTPKLPGSYRLIATIKDTKGQEESVTYGTWVVGPGHVVWNTKTEHALQIMPEADSYHVGDKARYLVKNPFPGALALITIERYGVLKSWTKRLEQSAEIIEFPVEPDYLPGFFLSITITSPRAANETGFGELDLGKPAFRMGYVEVPVRDAYKEIAVETKIAQPTYRPRDRVHIDLKAIPRHPAKGEAEPVELAVVVLDEAVFDLIRGGKSYFDPYAGFYKLDELDVQNFSLLLKLIGRQKFEKKGANPGGDGGKGLNMRDLFKFVAYWNPTLATDKDGKAAFDFDLPDNLTGWKVMTMAATPTDRIGLGEGHFTTNRPTEIRPVMPNQVTEGDAFTGGFSVMNRTDKDRTIKVTVKAGGDIVAKAGDAPYTETLKLAPYAKSIVHFPIKAASVKATRAVAAGEITFDVSAEDSIDGDRVVHKVPVHKMRSLLTAATYGTTTEAKVSESVEFPKDIHGDVGSVTVTASPTVIGNVEGAFEYLKEYPYPCWEQKLTKGAMASHYLKLKDYVSADFSWPEAKGLPDEMLGEAANYQTPSGAMAYYINRDEYADPYLSAYTAIAFRWLRAAGHKPPEAVEARLQIYLLKLLKQNVFPTFYSEGMSSSVRAVALAALADAGKANADDVRRYEQHRNRMDLFGKAHYMAAALKFPETSAIATETAKAILNQASESGGKFSFNETYDDSYHRILATPLRSNCAILSAMSTFARTDSGKKLIGDLPFKLVRSITQTRGARSHWENTQENMFCMSALVDYSRAYEAEKPDMRVQASLNSEPFGTVKFTDLKDKMAVFLRDIRPTDPGTKAKVEIAREGAGRLYYATRLQYAPTAKFTQRTNAGIEVRREFSLKKGDTWTLLKDNPVLARSDVVRVDIFVSLPTARNFVVIDDPIPGGLEPVNSDLATASVADADAGTYKAAGGSWFFHFGDWHFYNASRWSFYHKELRHDSARFYSEYLAPGNYHVSYTAQAIAPGEFEVMPTHVEEMYDPDVFGKDIAYRLKVNEAKP